MAQSSAGTKNRINGNYLPPASVDAHTHDTWITAINRNQKTPTEFRLRNSMVGHWDGDTLVVDTVGFNGRTRLDTVGHPHSDQLHLTERYTLADAQHIAYEIAVVWAQS
jgi:hypothetical protein